jgi:hypothetical protein
MRTYVYAIRWVDVARSAPRRVPADSGFYCFGTYIAAWAEARLMVEFRSVAELRQRVPSRRHADQAPRGARGVGDQRGLD